MRNAEGALPFEVLRLKQLTADREFYLSWPEFAKLLSHAMRTDGRCRLSLNRSQVGRSGLLHRFDWNGMSFTTVSRRPMALC